MEEFIPMMWVAIALLTGIVIGMGVKLSATSEQMQQLRADRYFHSRDIQRLEKLVGGPPKPPDCRYAVEKYGHDVFYKRST